MRCPNGFLGTFLNDMTILLLVTLLDKTVSVEKDSLCIRTLAYKVGGDRSFEFFVLCRTHFVGIASQSLDK